MGSNNTFPLFAEKTQRETITLDHFSTNDIGDLFFFVDFFHDSNNANLAGRNEVDHYGEIYYHLKGSNMGLSFGDSGIFKALDFGVGLNQGTDVAIALAGPRVSLNVPGFRVLSVGLYAYHNFEDPFNRSLDTTHQVTIVWDAPFDLGNQKFQFKGFVDFIGSQGGPVAHQIVFSPQIRWDLGHAIGRKAGKIHLGVEYTHFDNKFGISRVDEDSYSVFLGFRF